MPDICRQLVFASMAIACLALAYVAKLRDFSGIATVALVIAILAALRAMDELPARPPDPGD